MNEGDRPSFGGAESGFPAASPHSEASGQPAPESALDAKGISEGIVSALGALFEEHMQWINGFLQWSTNQRMNFQPVPPQADADFVNRQNWLIAHMKRFEAPAQMLAGAGAPALANALAGYLKGLEVLLRDFEAMRGKIAADDAATQAKIGGISNKMNADSLAAGATRMGIQQQTFDQTFEMNRKAMADQRASFERMNQGFVDNIDN